MQGCHSWAIGSGAYAPSQSLRVRTGTTLAFTDNDLMPHQLIQLAGPKVAFVGAGKMSHMGATTTITLAKPGIYSFGTKAGEDYLKGVKTIGPDNVLKLTVVVR